MALPENIIPSSEILHETIFTEFKGVNFLPPLLNQADFLREWGSGEQGQCLSVSLGETMQSRLNLLSLKNGDPMPSEISIQQLVDATTPKPVNYQKAVFEYVQKIGLVTAADYEFASPRPGVHLKYIEGRPTQKARMVETYFCGKQTSQLFKSPRRNEAVDDFCSFGPVIGEMTVTHEFLAYTGGIIKGENFAFRKQSERVLTHAAAIIGFGITRDKSLFWVMRNNWGPSFNHDGIFRIHMDLVYNVHSVQLSEDGLVRRRSSRRH